MKINEILVSWLYIIFVSIFSILAVIKISPGVLQVCGGIVLVLAILILTNDYIQYKRK